tara:strand:- start:33 stop:548 length:516 start_codon:yes stop_codon:yes gene_type:complete
MSKQSTFQIQQAAYAWLDSLEASDGEITPEAQADLDAIIGAADNKATALFFARQRCKSMQAEAKELADIAKVQKARWCAHEQRIMGLLKALLEAKEATGEPGKVKAAWGSASLRRVKSLTVLDEAAIPATWWTMKTTSSLDKARLKSALAGGESIPGAIVTDLVSATIRSK